MTTETVLTDDQREDLYCAHLENHVFRGEEGDAIIKAIEQAVLQSPEVQKMQVDAERYRWLRSSHVGPESLSSLHQWVNDDCNPPYTELKYGDELDAAIDAAMEKQP